MAPTPGDAPTRAAGDGVKVCKPEAARFVRHGAAVVRGPTAASGPATSGPADGVCVLVLANEGGLTSPTLEARASGALFASAGATCICCDHAISVGVLDRLLTGVHMLLFSGHADATVAHADASRATAAGAPAAETTLPFQRGGVAEVIGADALSRVISAHSDTLELVLLNGCSSLHLALRLVHAGIGAVICWETPVPDAAATRFGVGVARALAQGGAPSAAFDAGVSAVLTATELAPSSRMWVGKYALVDPAASSADPATGRLPDGNASAGRVAAGLPWLIRALPLHRLHSIPPLPHSYRARPHLEREAIDYIAAHRLRAASWVATDGAAPCATGPGILVLAGAAGCGKSALAVWLCNDLRVQSAFPDGIHFLKPRPAWKRSQSAPAEPRRGCESEDSAAATPAVLPPLGRQRCLIVIDDATAPPPLTGSHEQLLLVTTRLPHVAAALGAGGRDCLVVALRPLPSGDDAGGAPPHAPQGGRSAPAILSQRTRNHPTPARGDMYGKSRDAKCGNERGVDLCQPAGARLVGIVSTARGWPRKYAGWMASGNLGGSLSTLLLAAFVCAAGWLLNAQL